MATSTQVLAAARKWLGYVEGPRNNETRFGAWTGTNFQPWCAAFTSKLLHEAGLSMGKIAYVPASVAWFRSRGALHTTPQSGDVFHLWFPSKGRYAHQGFVDRVDGDWVVTCEGNSNSAGSRTGGSVVSLRRQWRGTKTVFGRPAYGSAPVLDEEDKMQRVVHTTKKDGSKWPGQYLTDDMIVSYIATGSRLADLEARFGKSQSMPRSDFDQLTKINGTIGWPE